MAVAWKAAITAERRAFLLEHHEAAHHGLLFSTPAGALLWRLNQSISRDIHYIAQSLNEFGVPIPSNRSPRKWLNGPEFVLALEHGKGHRDHNAYVRSVVDAVEKLLSFRTLLFETDAENAYGHMTIGDCLKLFRFVYPYLAARSGVAWNYEWTTRLDPRTRLFPNGVILNFLDIAECHAMAKELYILRAVGDKESFRERTGEALAGQFGAAFKVSTDFAKINSDFEYSPHYVQLAALAALSTGLDVTAGSGPLVIEDQLPWQRFSRDGAFSLGGFQQSLEALYTLQSKPLIGAESKWLIFHPIDLRKLGPDSSPDIIGALGRTLASFSLDIQIYLFHRASQENLRFLMGAIKRGNEAAPQEAFDAWNSFLFLNQAFVEYRDQLFHLPVEISAIYPSGHPLRTQREFCYLSTGPVQLLSHVVNGLCTRRSAASYSHHTVAKIDVVAPKIIAYISEHQPPGSEAGAIKSFVTLLIEAFFGNGRDLPFGREHLQESSKKTNFV